MDFFKKKKEEKAMYDSGLSLNMFNMNFPFQTVYREWGLEFTY